LLPLLAETPIGVTEELVLLLLQGSSVETLLLQVLRGSFIGDEDVKVELVLLRETGRRTSSGGSETQVTKNVNGCDTQFDARSLLLLRKLSDQERARRLGASDETSSANSMNEFLTIRRNSSGGVCLSGLGEGVRVLIRGEGKNMIDLSVSASFRTSPEPPVAPPLRASPPLLAASCSCCCCCGRPGGSCI
jgi:hypothetical protein